MRNFKFYSAALAGVLMLGACSSSDDLNGGASGESVNTSYLAVNIQNVGVAPSSRASYEGGKGSYEDGTDAESKINKVRFYFFNGDGTPYYVVNNTANSHVNYLDETVESNGQKHEETVEQVTKAVLVLKGETKTVPASVIAVINPDALDNTTLKSGEMTLSELRTAATGNKFYDSTNGFVMSNSVYEKAGQDVCSTPVASNICASEDAAKAKPVDIYVERVVAKVNAKIDAEYVRTGEKDKAWTVNADGKYQIQVGSIDVTNYDQTTNANSTTNTYPVYAVIQGWQIADANGKAELCKQINTAWYDGELGIQPWTTGDYHRSFWSMSVPFTSGAQGGVNRPVNKSFENINLSLTKDFSSTPVYTLPNTPIAVVTNPATSTNDLTKLIVAAKLVYKDGDTYKPAQICEYKGLSYLGQDNVKKLIAGENSKFFKKTKGQDGSDVYTAISPSDIVFKTVSADDNSVKDYEVIAQLADNAGDIYVKDGENWKVTTKDEVNKALATEAASVRSTDGDTYYYTPIKHLGSAGKLGEYGIVRNHSYQVTIQNVKGFGTPVFDPKREIDPMVPSNDNTYLAARVNVLSWRVVSSSVNLDQTNK